ncbi:ornithine cyclodeaminase family protein [Peristeroidobacter soli]|uniref:ornithine cyclodeaminase family protein n=1 Tax=Peristeroidobacter soli TaxID=2497877 RepID=UPI00101CA902|nr:ornithine cyclodeaminase family protein [Peristeroidobacter soli]
MRYIPEEISARLATPELAAQAAMQALTAVAQSGSTTFPVVVAHGSDAKNRFSIKSGSTEQLAGLKVGSYWYANSARGVLCHSSCILLFDQTIGHIDTVIEATKANAYRTAAANALAVTHLARREASRLAVFGAGNQAFYECTALMSVRPIQEILIVNRTAARADELASKLRAKGVSVAVVAAAEACAKADIIVTVTGSRQPLFDATAVRPGTHISCMGADAVGKQELPPELLAHAQLYCDSVEQSLSIGEFQHIAAAVRAGVNRPTNLGEVLSGRSPGRIDDQAITVFDSSGLALQDLYMGALLLQEAQRQGLVESP